MHIRRAVNSDFPTTAAFSVAAFSKDYLYQCTHPYAVQNPTRFRNYFLRRQKLRNLLPGFITWVAIIDEEDDQGETGLRGVHEAVIKEGTRIESRLLLAEDSYIDIFKLGTSVWPSRMRNLEEVEYLTDKFAVSERWQLQNIVVDPEYQRCGVGAKLISWGLSQAAEEKVPVTLTTSPVAEPLYRRMGFNTWKLTDLPGLRIGAPTLIWWPQDLKDRVKV
ncbi:MAG: hypothetical protein Q9224_004108 [Gallowayella concinna]